MIITAFNPSTDNLEKSYLTRNYAAGVTSIVVRNSNSFAVNSRIMIGEMGNENTEVVTVSVVNADKKTLTVGATSFPHTSSDPVYVLRYDQVKFYRSTTTIDGSYSSLATVSLDVDNANLKTPYDDLTGLSSYYYKISYYGSISGIESEMSDPIPGEGYGKKQVGTLINEFFNEIGDFQQEYITIPQVLSILNECNEDIIGQSRKPYRFLRKKYLLDITADNDRIDLPEELIKFDRVKYNRVDGVVTDVTGNIPMISIQDMEYRNYDTTVVPVSLGVGIQFAAIDETDNVLVLFPMPQTSQVEKLTVYGWSDFAYITSLADTFETPVKRIYKLFLLGRYWRMRAKKDAAFLSLSDRFINDYNAEVVKLQRAQKVDVGTPMSFKPDTRTGYGLRRSV